MAVPTRKRISKAVCRQMEPTEKAQEYPDPELKGFVLRVQPKGKKGGGGSKRFIFRYRIPGSDKQTSMRLGKFPGSSPEQARSRALAASASVDAGIDPAQSKRDEKAHTLETFLDGPYADIRSNTSKTKKAAHAFVSEIRSAFKGLLSKKLDKITEWDINKWRRDRDKSGCKKVTLNSNLAKLRSCLNSAVANGFIQAHQLGDIKRLRVAQKKPRILTKEEEPRLMATLMAREEKIRKGRLSHNEHRNARSKSALPLHDGTFADYLRPLIITALKTGMRRGELFQLRWSDVDFKGKHITVRGTVSKSSRSRNIPIHPDLLKALRDWQDQTGGEGLVFPGKDGKPLVDIKNVWKTVREAAGLKNLRFHGLRHTFGSRNAENGVSPVAIQKLMGYHSITQTEVYLQVSDDYLVKAIGQL